MQETQETQVRSVGSEDPLEEGLATHSSILAWRIPWTEEPGRLQSIGSHRVRLSMHTCRQKPVRVVFSSKKIQSLGIPCGLLMYIWWDHDFDLSFLTMRI